MFCKKRKLCLFWKEDLLGWYNPTRANSSPVFPQGDQRPSIFINISKSKDKNDRQIPKWNENTNKSWKRNLFLLIPAEIEFKEELVHYRCVGSESSFVASILCNRRLDRKNSGAQIPSGGFYHLNSLCSVCFLFFPSNSFQSFFSHMPHVKEVWVWPGPWLCQISHLLSPFLSLSCH